MPILNNDRIFSRVFVPLNSTHFEKGIELDVRKNEVILEEIGEKPKKKDGRDGEIRTRDLCTPARPKVNDRVFDALFYPFK